MKNVNHGEPRKRAVAEFLAKETFRFHGSKVLVFIPVHNEKHTIAEVVGKVRESCDFDLLVIDDRSDDATPHILQQLDVEVLIRKTNSDSRIINGLEVGYTLGYDYVIKIDGDGQHDPQDILRLYQHAVSTGVDIVIGSRHFNGFNGSILSIHGFGMWFCSKLVTLLSRKRITDTTSGFKIWSRRACEIAIQSSRMGKLKEASTFHVEELLIAAKNQLRVDEIGVVMHRRECGETKSFAKKELVTFPLNLARSTFRVLFDAAKFT